MNKKTKILLSSMFAIFMLASCGGNGGGKRTNNNDEEKEYSGTRANGIYDFTGESYEEKAKILGQLEGYAMKHHLAGIPLYDDAGYELFSPRIQLASETYVPNYGFGVGESSLNPTGNMFNNAPIDGTKVSHPTYFQSYATEDSGTFNYWNSSGSDVAGKNAMISSSYFTTRMNADKTGYEWEGELSRTDAPIALDENGNVVDSSAKGFTSRFWRVPVYCAEYLKDNPSADREFVYSLSENSKYYSKYDGLEIKLEDYLVPFKAMLDNGLKRVSGLYDDASGFYGCYEYLTAGDKTDKWGGEKRSEPTKDGKYFDGVGIKLNTKENSVDFKFITPVTQFYAKYNTASSLYSPIPQSFLDEVGAKTFGTYGTSSDPKKNVDNLISCGAYIVDSWEQKKETVYRKNSRYNMQDRIKFEGYVETGYQDEEAAFQGFLNGVIDEITVPSKHVSEYATNNLARKTEGSTVIKINVNSCTQSQWEKYFGKNGTAYPHANEKTYWDVKPIMSNDNFLEGLYFCINRAELANKTGHNPAYSYLSSAYKINPEEDLAFRDTPAGKAVTAEYESVETNGIKGYSPALAQQMFEKAIKELVADKTYDSDEEISLQFWWRKDENLNNLGTTIKAYIEQPFNDAAKKLGYDMTLNIKNTVAGSSYTDAYAKMDQGEFDFAEGAISGNVLNPLSFMSVICTNTLSQGFTTNWGDDTSLVSEKDPVMYKGVAWSYDALQSSANAATVVKNGHSIEPIRSTMAPTEDACYSEKKKSVIGFEIPGLTTADGDGFGIEYHTKEIDVLFAHENSIITATSEQGEYYVGWIFDEDDFDIKQDDSYLQFSILSSTIQSFAKKCASISGKYVDTLVLIVDLECYFTEYNIDKSATATIYVKLEQIGCEPCSPEN